jgi:uncharacterized protein YqgV (UPF0045/DUF77 family)
MKVIVDLCVVPIGVGVHLAPFIAACEKVLRRRPEDPTAALRHRHRGLPVKRH